MQNLKLFSDVTPFEITTANIKKYEKKKKKKKKKREEEEEGPGTRSRWN